MIRRACDQKTETTERKYGGEGTTEIKKLLNAPEEMSGKGRLFAQITLQPGCGIGLHEHRGESETFCFLQGEGEVLDDRETLRVGAGDVTHTPSGHSHAVKNTGDAPLVFIALILYQQDPCEN